MLLVLGGTRVRRPVRLLAYLCQGRSLNILHLIAPTAREPLSCRRRAAPASDSCKPNAVARSSHGSTSGASSPRQHERCLLPAAARAVPHPRYLLARTQAGDFTSLHFTSLHFTSLHFTSLHFTSLHFTSLHFTSLHFTSLHFTSQATPWPMPPPRPPTDPSAHPRASCACGLVGLSGSVVGPGGCRRGRHTSPRQATPRLDGRAPLRGLPHDPRGPLAAHLPQLKVDPTRDQG